MHDEYVMVGTEREALMRSVEEPPKKKRRKAPVLQKRKAFNYVVY